MVYVLDINGQPLMPTERYGKVRRMLKSGKAKVVKRCPFVIQLSYTASTREIQRISLGVDAGSKHIGKGAYRKRNQCPYEVKGFRLYDKVRAQNREWYVHGRRLKGSFVLKTLDGNMLEIVPSKISRIGSQAGFIIERRPA